MPATACPPPGRRVRFCILPSAINRTRWREDFSLQAKTVRCPAPPPHLPPPIWRLKAGKRSFSSAPTSADETRNPGLTKRGLGQHSTQHQTYCTSARTLLTVDATRSSIPLASFTSLRLSLDSPG